MRACLLDACVRLDGTLEAGEGEQPHYLPLRRRHGEPAAVGEAPLEAE
jgi:hypothetical protein